MGEGCTLERKGSRVSRDENPEGAHVGIAPSARGDGVGRDPLLAALSAEPIGMERLRSLAETLAPAGEDAWSWLSVRVAELEATGRVRRYPDGKLGPAVSPLV